MAVPNTPLMVAPSDAPDLLGRIIPSSEIIRGLIKLNPRIFCPDIDDNNHINGWHGVTSLWLGTPSGNDPRKTAARPICGIRLGAIPEWTQINSEGILITKGWRAIFDKVIRSGAATRTQLEVAFGVTLVYEDAAAPLCAKCIVTGEREVSNGGKRGYCETHDQIYATAARAKASAPENAARMMHRRKRIYNVGKKS
jgi:hypothetical protein